MAGVQSESQISQIRWLPCKNVGSEAIPPFSVAEFAGVFKIEGGQAGIEVKKVEKLTGSTCVFFTGWGTIEPGKTASCSIDFPVVVKVDTTVSAGDKLQTQEDSFVLHKVTIPLPGTFFFRAVESSEPLPPDTALVVRCDPRNYTGLVCFTATEDKDGATTFLADISPVIGGSFDGKPDVSSPQTIEDPHNIWPCIDEGCKGLALQIVKNTSLQEKQFFAISAEQKAELILFTYNGVALPSAQPVTAFYRGCDPDSTEVVKDPAGQISGFSSGDKLWAERDDTDCNYVLIANTQRSTVDTHALEDSGVHTNVVCTVLADRKIWMFRSAISKWECILQVLGQDSFGRQHHDDCAIGVNAAIPAGSLLRHDGAGAGGKWADKVIRLDDNEIGDVSITTPVANGEFFAFNTVSGKWENKKAKTNDLFDVTDAVANAGEFLLSDGTINYRVKVFCDEVKTCIENYSDITWAGPIVLKTQGATDTITIETNSSSNTIFLGGEVRVGNTGTPVDLRVFGNTRLDGDLFHSSSVAKLGVFGVGPVVRVPTYTVTNPTADRSFDAAAATLAELRNVVGTIITDLQGYGFFP